MILMVLHLRNLKSLETMQFYTTLTPDSHYKCTTWFQGSTPAQPEIFVNNIVLYNTCKTWLSLHSYNLISEFYTYVTWNIHLYSKVTYFTIHLHTLIFIILTKHDFMAYNFYCEYIFSYIYIFCTYICV